MHVVEVISFNFDMCRFGGQTDIWMIFADDIYA